MNDNWSLEGKAVIFDFNLRLLEKSKTDKIQSVKLFKEETIETLRKKVIGDTKELTKMYPISLMEAWEIILNKRFGAVEKHER